jgi:hypothetical protein
MRRLILGILFFAALGVPALADESPPAPVAELTYADLADLAAAAPVAARVRVKSAIAVSKEAAARVPAGRRRFYVEADVVSLIHAPGPMPALVRYLADLPVDPAGRAPKIKRKSEYLLLAAPVPGRADELRLIAPDAQLAWTAEREATIRSIMTEANAADAAPRIIGIGRAFHVPGTLPGESETQLFLLAAGGRPVSLNILRRPGQEASWAVALGEIVDESAAPPLPGTLLWYRLACGLPRTLPRQSLSEADPAAAEAIRSDYAMVLNALGPCRRSRPRS